MIVGPGCFVEVLAEVERKEALQGQDGTTGITPTWQVR